MIIYIRLIDYKSGHKKIIKEHHTNTLIHLETHTFKDISGEVVQSVAFVLERINNGII